MLGTSVMLQKQEISWFTLIVCIRRGYNIVCIQFDIMENPYGNIININNSGNITSIHWILNLKVSLGL